MHKTILPAALLALAFASLAHAQTEEATEAKPRLPVVYLGDYTPLHDRTLDYADLEAALARGLTLDEVATVAQIAARAGVPFRDVADAVLRGETFPTLADQYDLRLSDVLDVADERNRVATYMMIHERTGAGTHGKHYFPFGVLGRPMMTVVLAPIKQPPPPTTPSHNLMMSPEDPDVPKAALPDGIPAMSKGKE